ncbi:uncharacterized protein EV420DRAFT_554995 [Desarmillaria tabescens]|uniref:Uncharacterized protein n=1 Tax=Armillaria tabescens TaxID=1929756 RepID=A0AA39K7C1_ARMTA|nr:uncharacterized protein EV420DRAFT_554995 [Desarmillaria tabescens]KAK0455648.1 hypothetical protein EV420DRAFT_554995 [Desarmillaria tabescens]
MTTIQAAINDIRNSKESMSPSNNSTNTQPHQLSYAEATGRLQGPRMDPKHADTIAKARIANRRVIIKPTSDVARNRMKETTEKEMVERMNEALLTASAGETGTPICIPEEYKVVGAQKLVNGGIAYTFNTDKAAAWLREPNTIKAVQQAAGLETVASLQLHNMIVPFAPTTIDIGDTVTWQSIKESSGLKAGTNRGIRFLKPAEHHHEGQREAHIMIGFDSREQANIAIRGGIFIEGKELQARKELPDATRCVNCSMLPCNHDARDCPNTTKCGQCAGGHATKDCTVSDCKKFHCVNCKVNGHGAIDRINCPSFIRATDLIRSRYPES